MLRSLPAGQSRRGFTLLELIVVLLVLGVLAAIAVPTFNRIQLNSLEAALRAEAEALATAAQGIAYTDRLASGVVTTTHLQTAADEAYGADAPTAASSAVTLEESAGSLQCAVVVASVGGIATVGGVACSSDGSAPSPSAPSGFTSAGSGSGSGSGSGGSAVAGSEFDLSGSTANFFAYAYLIGADPWYGQTTWSPSNRYLYRYSDGSSNNYVWMSDTFIATADAPALASLCSTGALDGSWANVLLFTSDPAAAPATGSPVCP